MIHILIKVLKLLGILSILLICSFPGIVIAQMIEIKNGIKYIHNEGKGKWENEKNVKLERVGILGEIEGDDENYMFYLPANITGGLDENIYVVDSGNQRIQKYDKNLKYVCTIGRKGQGPGEFLTPGSIDVDINGNIWVWDYGNQRIQRFSPEGEYLDGIRTSGTDFEFRCLSTSEVLVRNRATGVYTESKNGISLFHVLGDKLKIKRKFGKSNFFNEHKTMRKHSGANRFKYTIDNQDNIYLTYLFQNKIEKYSYDGNLIFSMDRPVSKKFPASRRNSPMSPQYSCGIDIDSKGRIWAVAQRDYAGKGNRAGIGMITEDGIASYYVWGNTDQLEFDHSSLELFNNDGILLKIFPLKHWIDGFSIIDDKIYILDKLRGMRYHIYDIKIDK